MAQLNWNKFNDYVAALSDVFILTVSSKSISYISSYPQNLVDKFIKQFLGKDLVTKTVLSAVPRKIWQYGLLMYMMSQSVVCISD